MSNRLTLKMASKLKPLDKNTIKKIDPTSEMFMSQSLNQKKRQLYYDFLEEFAMRSTVFHP